MGSPRPVPSRRGRLLLEIPLALVLSVIVVYTTLRERVGDGGLALLADHEVLVRMNYVTGELSADDRSGAHTFVPWFEQVVRLDRRPVRYVMAAGEKAGDKGKGADLTAPGLIVRGRNGSSFAFNRVEILAVLDSERAEQALVDYGGDRDSTARLVDAYARPVLRQAFGRFTPREIVLPENKQSATDEATRTLAAALARHGIRVLEVSSSKPKFPDAYQQTIHRRKVAEQDTERLTRERELLEASADERESMIREEKEREIAGLRRELAASLRAAQRGAARETRLADSEAEERIASASLERDERLGRAALIEERHRIEAQTLVARLARLETQGNLAVRAALVERLGSIQFDLVPYDRENAPSERAKRTARDGGPE